MYTIKNKTVHHTQPIDIELVVNEEFKGHMFDQELHPDRSCDVDDFCISFDSDSIKDLIPDYDSHTDSIHECISVEPFEFVYEDHDYSGRKITCKEKFFPHIKSEKHDDNTVTLTYEVV